MIFALCYILLSFSDSTINVIVESSEQLFRSGISLSQTTDGKIFVVDQSNNSLNEISPNNTIARTIGGKGWGNYEFDLPSDVASSFLLDVFVVDKNNRRIQRYDKQLNIVQTYDETMFTDLTGRFQPRASALSSQGDLFIVEDDGKRIIKSTLRGKVEREFGLFNEGKGALSEPKDIAVSFTNEIFVLDKQTIKIYDIFGNYLRTIPLSKEEHWKSINLSDELVIVVSSSHIEIISSDLQERRTIVPSSIIGASMTTKAPFVDALFLQNTLIILTETTIYRCVVQ